MRDNSAALVGLVSGFFLAIGLWFLEFPRAVTEVRAQRRDARLAALRFPRPHTLLGAEERVEATLVCQRSRVGSYVLESR